ncbi:MAG: single-stranded DNA-binding protein, partial [Bacilli bacterium]
MNKVILVGRLTKDPEQRLTQNSLEISRFSVACQGEFVSKTGEREVEFVNCVAFNKTATTINKYCKKGSLLSINGRIKNGSYEAKDGTKRYTTEVV